MPVRPALVPVKVSGKAGGEVRISAWVKKALEAMVLEGKSRNDAALAAGMTDNALWKALKQPKVLAYRTELMRHLLGNEASRSVKRIATLADTSQSDHVRLQASQFMLACEGISPKEHHIHDHRHTIVPGYVLDPSGPDLSRPDHLRDVTPADDGPVIEHDQPAD